MHTKKLEKHNIHYSSDLSGEIIINGNGDELNTTAEELIEIVKTLGLFSVCQHRELLNALSDSIEKEFETYAYLPDLIEHIKAFNCG